MASYNNTLRQRIFNSIGCLRTIDIEKSKYRNQPTSVLGCKELWKRMTRCPKGHSQGDSKL